MPRELTNLEIDQFLQRHPDVDLAVWDITNYQPTALPLAYPDPGLAVKDPSGRYVLVWRDASLFWHYIDLADMTLMDTIAQETNRPAYISDPDYLGLLKDQLPSAKDLINWTALGLIVVGAVIVGKIL